MFKLAQSTSYKWSVKIELPVDGGKFEKATFDAEFKRISQTRINELRTEMEKPGYSELDLAKEVLIGWNGVVDSDGNEIPFSEGNRDKLLDIPTVAVAIGMSFFESLAGAKRKN